MTPELLTNFIFTCILSICFALNLYLSRYIKNENKDEENRPRYLRDISNIILPIFLIIFVLFGSFLAGIRPTLEVLFSVCFTVFLHISIYYLILLSILPSLRKRISARACYMLWIIPNYLYLTFQTFMSVEKPAFVIKLPGNIVWILFIIWSAGFILVFAWNIVNHLLFRRQILDNAKEIRNPEILGCWERELDYSRIKYRKYKLFTSTAVRTPLSIGFRRSICVVLPHKNYTEEEFSLIFRHELIHISREDGWTKFFLVFCTAMCWFNPLMWYAMKKSAEDIELTCDEFVLEDMTEESRLKYASLILETTGDQRGFTTCLSASAKTLKYRLKSITKPKKTYSGAVTVGIMTFLLFISCGYVALAYGTYSGADLIYQGEDSSMYLFDEVKSKSDFSALHYDTFHGILDESAFHQYLENLDCMHLTGNYSFSDNTKELYIAFTTPDNSFLWLTLSDHHIKIVSPKNDLEREVYYLPEPTDWDYLDSILIEYPAIDVHLYQEKKEDPYGSHLQPLLYQVYRNDSDLIYQADVSIKEANGTYGATVMAMTKAELSFSQMPISSYKVTIESADRLTKTEYSQENLAEPNTIPLPGYDATFIIAADFEDKNGEVYRAEFVFNLGGAIEN